MWRSARLLTVLLAIGACRPSAAGEPAPIAYGSTTCDYCHMTVNTSSHAAQLVPASGSPRTFDEAGCLLNYLARAGAEPLGQAWVHVEDADEWLPADSAFYLVPERSGGNLMFGMLAFRDQQHAADHAAGRVLRFSEVLAELRS